MVSACLDPPRTEMMFWKWGKALLWFFLHDKWFSERKWFLDLCMHSHTKKIEMCNACLHLRNTGVIKMGFGFTRALASEEKSNSLSQLENVCFLNICLQSLLFVPICFYRSSFPPFVFCGGGKGGGLRGFGAGWEDDFSTLVAEKGRRSSRPAACSIRCVC